MDSQICIPVVPDGKVFVVLSGNVMVMSLMGKKFG